MSDGIDRRPGMAGWAGRSPNPLILLGFTNNSLAAGVKILVEGYQAPKGIKQGYQAAR
jgi:hypothetical protein